MSLIKEGYGHDDFHIYPCPKCGKVPTVVRSTDPAEIQKRYSVRCTSEGCRINKGVYGPTETFAIVEWNNFACKITCPKTPSEGIVHS